MYSATALPEEHPRRTVHDRVPGKGSCSAGWGRSKSKLQGEGAAMKWQTPPGPGRRRGGLRSGWAVAEERVRFEPGRRVLPRTAGVLFVGSSVVCSGTRSMEGEARSVNGSNVQLVHALPVPHDTRGWGNASRQLVACNGEELWHVLT